MKKFWISGLLLLAICCSGAFGQTDQAPTEPIASLSDLLPLAFVDTLKTEGLWMSQFDVDSPESRDMRVFWKAILTLPAPGTGIGTAVDANKLSEDVVDNLFGYLKSPVKGAESLENLYPVKFRLIRFIMQPADGEGNPLQLKPGDEALISRLAPQVADVHRRWLNRYLDGALAAVNMGGIGDYQPITEDFTRKLLSDQIKIADLSPTERLRLRDSISSSHGVSIDARVSRNSPNYKVVGLFNNNAKYLALDFARPIEDTLTTFSHEIVHASDPRLKVYLQTYKDYYPKVWSIIVRWGLLKNPDDINVWKKLDFLGLIDTSYEKNVMAEDYEYKKNQRAVLVSDIEQDLKDQMAELHKRAVKSGSPKLSPDSDDAQIHADIDTLRTWVRSLIGLTVENEYRAQGLSILLLATLTYKAQFLFPNDNLDRYLDRFQAGDAVFGFNLSQAANPMPRFRTEILSQFGDRQDDSAVGSVMALDFLQSLYYDETQLMLDKLKAEDDADAEELQKPEVDRGYVMQTFSGGIRALHPKKSQPVDVAAESGADDDGLPEWTEPGKYGLPSNPHQLITSIPTTSWVLGYKHRLMQIEADLRKLMDPIINWRVGILDLHDLSVIDLRRVGVLYASNPNENVTPNRSDLEACLKSNQDMLVPQEEFDRYFTPVKKEPPDSLQAVRGEDIMVNLVGHRMIRANVMLQKLYPILKNDLFSLRLIQEKLGAKRFLHGDSDFTPERIEELKQEIEHVQGYTSVDIKDDVQRLAILMESVETQLEGFATERKWESLRLAFYKEKNRIFANLESSGVFGGQDFRSILIDVKKSSNRLRDELAPYYSTCQGLWNSWIGKAKREDDLPKYSQYKADFPLAPSTPRFTPDAASKQSFPLILTCQAGRIFAVRPPCDFDDFMTREPVWPGPDEVTSEVLNPRSYGVEARIGFGSRKILLEPVNMASEPLDETKEDSKSLKLSRSHGKIYNFFHGIH